MKLLRLFSLAALAGLLIAPGATNAVAQAQATSFADPAFQNVWNRTDALVAQGQTSRTWFWGPQPNTPGILETYTDAPNGSQRLVQYFDKSRMEINDPNADPSSPFYVTNGLLTVELISGCIQTGQAACGEQRYPAEIPMSGDQGDQLAPTYAAFRNVANTSAGDHPADNKQGQSITATIDHAGTVGDDQTKASIPLTKIAYYEPITKHNIPEAFWNFVNQSGLIVEQGKTTSGPLSSPWFYATGLPISEAYWARATIGGQVKDVMIQAFERRVLTYTPTNDRAFQVEMGNIGQHYYDWRYNFAGQPADSTLTPVGAPTYAAAPTGATPVATSTTGVTATATPAPEITTAPTEAAPVVTETPATAAPTASTTPEPSATAIVGP